MEKKFSNSFLCGKPFILTKINASCPCGCLIQGEGEGKKVAMPKKSVRNPEKKTTYLTGFYKYP
jgi:hypothetical protein